MDEEKNDSERREHPRLSVNIEVNVKVGEHELHSRVKNLSVGGGFLEIADESMNEDIEELVGKPASFAIGTGALTTEHHGRIARVIENEGKKYIAVAFFD